MGQFTYCGLTFEPHRNFRDDEKNSFHKYIQRCDFSPWKFSHEDFYEAAGEGNNYDLFICNGEIVLPTSDRLMLYNDPMLPDHYVREMTKKADMAELLRIIDDVGADGFYPTPPALARDMLAALSKSRTESILEPSAGKGDLIDAIREWQQWQGGYERDVDCIEINPDLCAILKDKGYRVIHDDFLTFHTYKHYDLILMNPPFAEGDKHLLKALELAKRSGGTVVCLLNARTLKNRYTNLRRLLWDKLTEYNAVVTYYEGAFADAERPTDVEIAMVRVTVPGAKAESSEIYEKMEKAYEAEETRRIVTELAPNEFIAGIIRQFEVETSAGLELIRQYKNMVPYMLVTIDPGVKDPGPIIRLSVDGSNGCSENRYLQLTRAKYWRALLSNDESTGKLTSKLRDKYLGMVEALKNYDFSMFNIRRVEEDILSEMVQGLEDEILALFEKFTVQHSWYPECQKNIHYYSGWATNKAHKINSKVIIPSYGLFSDWQWSKDTFRVYEAYNHLADIEKVFNYLDGNMTAEVDLHATLTRANANGQTKKIPCKYFDVTFYKKGTTHIFFRNQELLDKFNIYASRKKNWLPPFYGRIRYEDMDEASREVIDSFQGAEAYAKVVDNSRYFLVETKQMLALPAAA